jgi:hypothetical protein
VAVARARGFALTGTLALLDQTRPLKLDEVFARLKATNFRYSQEIIDGLLVEADEELKE